MKKLLVVGDFISGSGLTGVIFDVFSRFPKDEYQIEVVGYGHDSSHFTDKKCQKLGWPMYRVVPVTKDPLAHWRWWKDFFKTHHYDMVYFNYSSSWNYLPVVYARKYGQVAEIICHSHNAYYSHTFSNPIMMGILGLLNDHGKKVFDRYADKKIATSPEAGEWMFGQGARDVHVITNGRNLKQFSFSPDARHEIREQMGLAKGAKLVGFVGVLQERKNPLFALRVFSDYHQENPGSRMVMLGRGPLKPAVKELIRQLELTDAVSQIDFVADVNRWYSAMDALLFPSSYEGFALVAVEAQISNLPTLASSLNTDAIFVTQNIRKMEGFDVHDWNRALAGALADNPERQRVDPKLNQFGIDAQVETTRRVIEGRV